MLSESLRPYFEWCSNTWLGSTIRDNVWAFPVIETFHLLALAVLIGTVLIVNLRVFGLGRRYFPAAQMARQLEPWMLVSLSVLIASGIPMAFSEPIKCFESYSFPIKMGLSIVGIVSQFTIQRKRVMAEDAIDETQGSTRGHCVDRGLDRGLSRGKGDSVCVGARSQESEVRIAWVG